MTGHIFGRRSPSRRVNDKLTDVSNLSIIFRSRKSPAVVALWLEHKPGKANPVQTNMNDVVLKASNCNGTSRP
jgi:hypothetical protein